MDDTHHFRRISGPIRRAKGGWTKEEVIYQKNFVYLFLCSIDVKNQADEITITLSPAAG